MDIKSLEQNFILLHLDSRENIIFKFPEEILTVHFESYQPQRILHSGFIYTKNGHSLNFI